MKHVKEDLWVHEDSMRVAGMVLRLRMTVARLGSGKLWVHSPTSLSDELKREIDALGSVAFILGPNNTHNLWLREWQKTYPTAELCVSRGIPRKLHLVNYHLLEDVPQQWWGNDFECASMPGVPFFDEFAFFHRKSRSLIVTDLIQNHSGERPPGFAGFLARFVLEPLGWKGVCVAPPLKLGFTIRNKAAFRAFLETIRSWDFERIIVTHGDIIEQDARTVFKQLTSRFIR